MPVDSFVFVFLELTVQLRVGNASEGTHTMSIDDRSLKNPEGRVVRPLSESSLIVHRGKGSQWKGTGVPALNKRGLKIATGYGRMHSTSSLFADVTHTLGGGPFAEESYATTDSPMYLLVVYRRKFDRSRRTQNHGKATPPRKYTG